jgi:hypothetical protein
MSSSEEFKQGRMEATLERIESDIKEIQAKLDSHYVTQSEFAPVKNIVYGLVGSILLAVLASIVALVVK